MYRIIAALVIFISSTFNAYSDENDEINKFVNIVDKATPIYLIFEKMLDANSNWPLNAKASAVTEEELGCVRNYFSKENMRSLKHKEAVSYAKKNRHKLKDDINLLDSGLAETAEEFFRATADNNSKPPVGIALKLASLDPEHMELYRLLMIDQFYSQNNGLSRSLMKFFYNSLEGCGVDIESIFKKNG